MEGQSVTLYCQATSHPLSVIWSWCRLDEQGGWQEVDMGRELTLSMASESGQYICHAYSNISSPTQQQQSPSHTVYIVYFPMTGNLLVNHNIHLISHMSPTHLASSQLKMENSSV